MRTETTTRVLYTVDELRDTNPRGFDRALDAYIQHEHEWHDASDEWHSLKVFDDHIGYRRDRYTDWDMTRGLGEVGGLTGRRAWAWLENAVLADYRLAWIPVTAPGARGKERRNRLRYGERAGAVPSCPFTGYHVDETILDDLRKSLRGGLSVQEAVRGLEETVQREVDADLEYRCSAESFIDYATDSGWEFTEQGVMV